MLAVPLLIPTNFAAGSVIVTVGALVYPAPRNGRSSPSNDITTVFNPPLSIVDVAVACVLAPPPVIVIVGAVKYPLPNCVTIISVTLSVSAVIVGAAA